jgi:hypothetical protein
MSQYTVEHRDDLTDDDRLDAIMTREPVPLPEACAFLRTCEDEYGLDLLDARLGGHFNASMFATTKEKSREIREKHGLEGVTDAQ